MITALVHQLVHYKKTHNNWELVPNIFQKVSLISLIFIYVLFLFFYMVASPANRAWYWKVEFDVCVGQ